jgi:hypothetical protein
MKKIALFLVFMSVATVVFAGSPFDQLSANLVQGPLDSLAKDLGALIGGGTYRSGKTIGFPGLDVSARVVSKTVTSGNKIAKDSGSDSLMWPALQVELGLPMNIDFIGRYMFIENTTMTGLGVRSCLYKSTLPGVPSLSIQGMYNSLKCTVTGSNFSATTLSAAAMMSFNIPVIDPYIGVGTDQTELKPDASDLKGTASGTKIEAGINLTVFPMSYLQIGIAVASSEMLYNASLGLKF